MKRRLVFLSRDHDELCEIVEMLNQSHLNCWRWRIFTGAAADVQRLGLPPMFSALVCRWHLR